MKSDKKTSAIILAAGLSSRMGAFKPLLTLGGRLIIEVVIDLFREAGISDIIVVVGYQAGTIIPHLEKQGVRWVINEGYEGEMFASVQIGVKKLTADCGAFFLCPADIPLVTPSTLKKLVAAYREGDMDVYHPCYGQRRGHPPLISTTLVPSILAFTGPGGMGALLARCRDTSLDVPCDDPGIHVDLNTPDDYERAQTQQRQ